MIRTRLAIAFSALALLALAQSGFAWWAASTAADLAGRSVNATRMLAEYLEISGNKQRLKVWYAQRVLANDPAPEVRDALIKAMHDSVATLGALAEQSPPEVRDFERAEARTVAENIANMTRAIEAVERPGGDLASAEQWRTVLLAFDELAGRDMRELLRQAVDRSEARSLAASAELTRALDRIRQVELLLAISLGALAVLSVLYFVRRLDRPFAALARMSSSLAAGDFQARTGLAGRDEFARIGGLLDSMAGRLSEAQERSRQLQRELDELVSERTRSLTHAYETLLGIEARRRQFFAELSHEIRTPVTVIRGEAEVALRDRSDAGAQGRSLERIIQATVDLSGRVTDLLEAARSGSLEYALCVRQEALLEVVSSAVSQMQAVAAHRGIRLELQAGPRSADVVVDADRERLQQALVILLDNALRYSPRGTRVTVELDVDAEHCLVGIADEGMGLTEEELLHAFEPNFRGETGRRLAPQGSGLGLTIARRIVEAQGGSIELHNRPAGGLLATLALPVASPVEAG